jgi:Domain of unknown function (DUF4124)
MKRPAPVSLLLVLAGVIALAGSAVGQSGNWKYRDAQGRTVVSDLPPPAGVQDKDILVRPTAPLRRAAPAAAPASAAAATPQTAPALAQSTDPELEARRKKVLDEQQTQKKLQDEKDSVQRADNCARAKSHLAALADGQRIARTNAQGEREILDDKGRAEEMQRARQVIASDCK